jgi:hypothetical protein
MNTAEAKDLCNKIPKFSGQKEEIRLEEFVQQIENFADLVQRVDNKDSKNGAICYLFRRLLTGKANQIWKNVKRQFQMRFPAEPKPTMVKNNPKVH